MARDVSCLAESDFVCHRLEQRRHEACRISGSLPRQRGRRCRDLDVRGRGGDVAVAGGASPIFPSTAPPPWATGALAFAFSLLSSFLFNPAWFLCRSAPCCGAPCAPAGVRTPAQRGLGSRLAVPVGGRPLIHAHAYPAGAGGRGLLKKISAHGPEWRAPPGKGARVRVRVRGARCECEAGGGRRGRRGALFRRRGPPGGWHRGECPRRSPRGGSGCTAPPTPARSSS